ncbi:hypothetical protein TSA66_00855 [Noviherbaspirillum autotrophicum]|uniref:Uncharacterized protein n=2 Tax=Noviherbaspirillum autotrophicum TaxID=709839 RepID=A0A0C1Y118_9BURK|nr:hypothetical protein TSA66_07920 [Noviherbaspirillum autotrophicum]KIF80800.1 hypothetical protein TSA66_08165 [Noviherbaspirillum autotrophicum]KIF84025.1 hypothetical protein TSA66_00855 [Noviherbaspirillum autotrophicum]
MDAMEESEDNAPAWRAAYVSIVNPLSVLEMAEIIEAMLAELETHHDAGPLIDNIKARLGIA